MFNPFKGKKKRKAKKDREEDKETEDKKEKKVKPEEERPLFDIHRDAIKSVWGIVFLTFFIISILSLFDMAGRGGELFVSISETVFGIGKYSIPLVFIAASFILFTTRKRNAYFPLFIGAVLFFTGILGILSVGDAEGDMRGGYWGFLVSWPLVKSVGDIASIVVLMGFIMASVVISFNVRVSSVVKQMMTKKELEEAAGGADASEKGTAGGDGIKVKTWNDAEDSSEENSNGKNLNKISAALKRKSREHDEKDENSGEGDFKVKSASFNDQDFRLPPTELLEKETGKPSSRDIVANANIIKRTLQN